jgi:molybdopterin-guanine dinucleotide biosynthesis protein A
VIEPGLVSLGILAGGQARRLGGRDKARIMRDGRTQLMHVLAAFPLPFREKLLSYNRDPAGLAAANLRVVSDLTPGYAGPVAALEALAARMPFALAAHGAGRLRGVAAHARARAARRRRRGRHRRR